MVAKQNGATNAAAAAIGGILISASDPIDFVRAGRVLQRAWLTATSLGLSLQPLTGILFFDLLIKNEEAREFSTQEKDSITRAYRRTAQLFQADEKRVAFMFRIGKGEAPSARASRLPLSTVVEHF